MRKTHLWMSVAFALGSALLSSLILIVFIVFFLIQGEQFTNAFLHAIPGNNYGLAKRMLQKTTQQVHAYIRGQLLAGSSVAISSIIPFLADFKKWASFLVFSFPSSLTEIVLHNPISPYSDHVL